MGTRLIWMGLACLALTACADDSADHDGNGTVSAKERASEMATDGFITMQAGRWETKFVFTDIDVPALGQNKKQQIMDEIAKIASSASCLSPEEAKNPGADFFGGDGAENCTYKAFDLSGQNARMKLVCSMEGVGSVDMDLNGSMAADSFDFDSNVAMRLPMVGKVALTGKAEGRYAGACKGDE